MKGQALLFEEVSCACDLAVELSKRIASVVVVGNSDIRISSSGRVSPAPATRSRRNSSPHSIRHVALAQRSGATEAEHWHVQNCRTVFSIITDCLENALVLLEDRVPEANFFDGFLLIYRPTRNSSMAKFCGISSLALVLGRCRVKSGGPQRKRVRGPALRSIPRRGTDMIKDILNGPINTGRRD